MPEEKHHLPISHKLRVDHKQFAIFSSSKDCTTNLNFKNRFWWRRRKAVSNGLE